MNNKFVFAIKEIKIDGITIKQNEIGFIKIAKDNLLSVYFIVERLLGI